MKKFTKLFLSCAIVSAVAAATASMAMAAELDATYDIKGDFTGTYTAASNDITSIAGVTPDENTEVTFLVYKQGADAATVAAADVIGIDQNTSDGTDFAKPENNGLKTGTVTAPDDGQNTYVVKIGYYTNNEFKVATAKFVTGTATGESFIIGDSNLSGTLQTLDASLALRAYLEKESNTGSAAKQYKLTEAIGNKAVGDVIQVADANLSGGLQTLDASLILRAYLEKDSNTGYAGQTATGTPVE